MNRLTRWAPAAGVLSGILLAVAIFSGPSSPGDNATGAQVIAWYTQHKTSDKVGDLIGCLAMLLFMLFAAVLPRYVRKGDRWLAHGAVAAAAFGAIALVTIIGIDFVIATDVKYLTVSSAQTLSLLENDLFLPIAIGFAAFGILAGAAVITGRIIPKWLGWVLVVLGIAAAVPPIAFFALLGFMLWLVVGGIWMIKEGPPAPEVESTPTRNELQYGPQ